MPLLDGTYQAEAFLSENRAFRYGDGLFETLRVWRGKLLFVEDHFRRLRHGMRLLGYPTEEDFFIQLRREIAEIQQRTEFDSHARIRIQLWRESPGAYAPQRDSVRRLVELFPLAADTYTQAAPPLRIGDYRELSVKPSPLSGVKSCSALVYVLAARHARRAGWDEAVLFNGGHAVEASSSNLFVMRKEELLTPNLESGCLPGVFRQNLIRAARALGFSVREASLSTQDLAEADGVFLTNVIRGIQPVGWYEGQDIPTDRVESLRMAWVGYLARG